MIINSIVLTIKYEVLLYLVVQPGDFNPTKNVIDRDLICTNWNFLSCLANINNVARLTYSFLKKIFTLFLTIHHYTVEYLVVHTDIYISSFIFSNNI